MQRFVGAFVVVLVLVVAGGAWWASAPPPAEPAPTPTAAPEAWPESPTSAVPTRTPAPTRDPSAPPTPLDATQASFERFLTPIDFELDPEESPEARDGRLREALSIKSAALKVLDTSLNEIVAAGDPRHVAHAQRRIGAVHEEMAAWLEAMPDPTGVPEASLEVYRARIAEKAHDQRVIAQAAYTAALEATADEALRAELRVDLDRVASDPEDLADPRTVHEQARAIE
jgi:hypothetical protein